MRQSRSLGLGVILLLTSACGKSEPAPSMPSQPRTPPVASASVAAPTPSSEPASSAEAPKKRRPYEVYSACADVVSIVFGDDPKTGGRRTLAQSSTIEGVRNADGNQTVWLLDTNGEPLVKVNVTRGMKRVEVGKSCRTLDAH